MSFATPDAAEEAFYAAFAGCDMDAMASVWLDDDSIICIHPASEYLRGRDAVLDSWRRILGVPLKFPIRHTRLTCFQGPVLAVHIGMEAIQDSRAGAISSLTVSNVFQLSPEGWRMLVHHAGAEIHTRPASGRREIH